MAWHGAAWHSSSLALVGTSPCLLAGARVARGLASAVVALARAGWTTRMERAGMGPGTRLSIAARRHGFAWLLTWVAVSPCHVPSPQVHVSQCDPSNFHRVSGGAVLLPLPCCKPPSPAGSHRAVEPPAASLLGASPGSCQNPPIALIPHQTPCLPLCPAGPPACPGACPAGCLWPRSAEGAHNFQTESICQDGGW